MSFLASINRQKAEDQAKRGGPIANTPNAGRSVYRALPGEWGSAKAFSVTLGQHWVTKLNDDGTESKFTQVCLRDTKNEDCPVCRSIYAAKRLGVTSSVEKQLDGARSNMGYYMNVLHRNGDDPEKPILLKLTPRTYESLRDQWVEYGRALDDPDAFDPTDLQNGLDFVVVREGTGRMNTTYTVMLPPKSNPVDPAVMGNVVNLDDFIEGECMKDRQAEALENVRSIAGMLPPPQRPQNFVRPALAGAVSAPIEAEDAVFTEAEIAESQPEQAVQTIEAERMEVQSQTVEAPPVAMEVAPPTEQVVARKAPEENLDEGELDALIASL